MVCFYPLETKTQRYLEPTAIIDFQHPDVSMLAKQLAKGKRCDVEITQSCFQWVRDQIKHSWDYKLNPVTCSASEVLIYKTGYCYAKSHLLAALLRANKIPSGFCYQRLSLEEKGAPYCLHGLNAVYLSEFGWYRVDPRGNNETVNAQCLPPIEQLAFTTLSESEMDFPQIWAEPLPEIINVLQNSETIEDVYVHLPDDIEI